MLCLSSEFDFCIAACCYDHSLSLLRPKLVHGSIFLCAIISLRQHKCALLLVKCNNNNAWNIDLSSIIVTLMYHSFEKCRSRDETWVSTNSQPVSTANI